MERLVGIVRKWVKFFGIIFLLVLVAGTSLEFLVPREQLRALCVQKLQERLKRQVKIGVVSIGPWRGLRVEGLEISEAPDFAAGTFLSAERLTVKPSFLPLLMGRVAVGELQLTEPRLRVARVAGGLYNFSGIIEAESKAQGVPAAQAPVKKRDAVALLTAGWDDPKKKLGELGAFAAGAAAGAATRLQIDIERLRVRRGSMQYVDEANKVQIEAVDVSVWAEGLTPKSSRTDIDLDGKLTGTLQDEKAEAEFKLAAKLLLNQAYYPETSIGHLVLNKIRHPNFTTERVRADWDLHDLTPDLKTAKGVVKLEGSPGQLDKPAFIARQGKWPALLLYPIEVLAKFRGLGLPDLIKIPYNELKGEYSFQGGSVNLAPLYVRGPLVSINAEGVLNLVERTVGLKANVIMGASSIGVLIRGPMDAPSVEGDLSLKGPKPKHRTTHQAKENGDLLEQAFGPPDSIVPDPAAPRAPGKPGRPAGPKVIDRKQNIKDAENIIDAPLPEQ